jgi:hypothetical protein
MITCAIASLFLSIIIMCPIPAETDVGQFDEEDIHARLLEVAHGAMVIGGVK